MSIVVAGHRGGGESSLHPLDPEVAPLSLCSGEITPRACCSLTVEMRSVLSSLQLPRESTLTALLAFTSFTDLRENFCNLISLQVALNDNPTYCATRRGWLRAST